jgi:ornithine cyclodeaminase/alanine dehydrogenase-like protein (mu-crystallin family)
MSSDGGAMLLIGRGEVEGLVTLEEAVDALYEVYADWAGGAAAALPRIRFPLPQATFHVLVARAESTGLVGCKLLPAGLPRTRTCTALWSCRDGTLLCLVDSSTLSPLRTAATSVLGARLLARPESRSLALLGAGRQARSQLLALAAAFPLDRVVVWSRTAERAEELVRDAGRELGLPLSVVQSPRDAVAAADLVVTATRATEPVLAGRWLRPGSHVTAIGADQATRRELDAEVVRRAAVVVVDSLEQARRDSGDLIAAIDEQATSWDAVIELGAVVRGNAPARSGPKEITVLAHQGSALGDVALAALAYRRAREQSLGLEVDW